ncbi:MAG: hypothetical protein ACRCZ5_02915, partial [Burkholderiales bacterium]
LSAVLYFVKDQSVNFNPLTALQPRRCREAELYPPSHNASILFCRKITNFIALHTKCRTYTFNTNKTNQHTQKPGTRKNTKPLHHSRKNRSATS